MLDVPEEFVDLFLGLFVHVVSVCAGVYIMAVPIIF